MPGLAEWKERVLALVPDAPVDVFESDLLRTAPDDRLRRSFAITRAVDGSVVVPMPLTGGGFRAADKAAPKDGSWWAFPVCPDEHTLPANSRAILEQVRHDPAITKVVLTRSRAVHLDGENVVVLPLSSPEGQRHLMRCGTVFVKAQPRRTLGEPLGPDHRIVLVRDGLLLDAERRGEARRIDKVPVPRWHAALTASDVDRLAVLGLNYPGLYEQGWRTGIPAHDFLVGPADVLPPEIAQQETRLRDELAGQRLLLLAPGRAPHALSVAEVGRLSDWAAGNGTVIGVREQPSDQRRTWSVNLTGIALDLSHHRYPSVHAVLRATDAVLTDYSGTALDLAMTGRPVVSLTVEAAPDTLVLDPDHVFPGPVCRTFDDLMATLERIWEAPSADDEQRHERRRRLLADTPDGRSAARVVAAVTA